MSDVAAVATDLLSQSRIAACARALNRPVRFVASGDEVEPGVELLLVDLDADADVLALIRLGKDVGAQVIAFGPHLEGERLKAARAAGADRVLARSKFVTELPRLLGPDSAAT
jgi:hypothetical protein